MIIKVLKRPSGNTADEMEPEEIDKIELLQINSFSIASVAEKVGYDLTAEELQQVLNKVKPSDFVEKDERYAGNVPAWMDGDSTRNGISIPHYIGFRLVLDSILQKYGTSTDLIFQLA